MLGANHHKEKMNGTFECKDIESWACCQKGWNRGSYFRPFMVIKAFFIYRNLEVLYYDS